MNEMKKNVVIKVEKNSIAEELGIVPGDTLIAINDKPVLDVFDYRFLIQDDYIEMAMESANGEEWVAEIEKEPEEDIGIVFGSGLMDKARSCRNKCIFCFIDQLPPNMRETLYFKDDDSRLSFLQGNYVTMTNMSEQDIDRIVYYHLSPINISVHTTDLELRKKMLKNPNAVNVLKIMDRLAEASIEMNLQVVLCKGINDGEQLDKTISDLSKYYPHARSMSVVPIGLTKYREGLYPMEPFEKEDARAVAKQIEWWQNKLKRENGAAFVFCSDEFYLKGELPMPNYDCYEGFPQLENGVGMMTLMEREFTEALGPLSSEFAGKRTVSIATGMAAYEFICGLCKRLEEACPGLTIYVYAVENKFFGEKITVAGLLCGQDIVRTLQGKKLGDCLLLPDSLLKSGERILLDDMTIEDIEKQLSIPIKISSNDGGCFIKAILDTEENK